MRPYQTAAVAAVSASWACGQRRVVVALPTGAGKSVIAAAALAGGHAPLALVHTLALRDQARALLPAHCTVATVQGALRLPTGALEHHDRVWIDECHHVGGSGAWQALPGLLAHDALLIGTTATPTRADGAPLASAFDSLVAPASYSHLIRNGWLAPCRVIDATSMAGDPARAYLIHGAGRPGIVFTGTISEAHVCVAALASAGVRAAAITETTQDKLRRWAMAAYARGELTVLVSPVALAEGADMPNAAVCVLDTTCGHVGTYLQKAGRVLRAHPSKVGPGSIPALLVDLRGAARRHGSPTDDREYSLSGGIQRATRRDTARRTSAPRAIPTRSTAHTRSAHRVGYALGSVARFAWGCLQMLVR